MTTHRKRRSRRPVAALVAALMLASVLAAVAGTPVQAANTAREVLFDHDNNASTAEVRQFGGVDRYDTAVRLAMQYADSRGGLGAVPTAFLASGESLVDAVAVAGLAGDRGAPVLLTRPDVLHTRVGNFIQRYGIQDIWILGGSAAVSEGVEEAVRALENGPTVQRIVGTDRYETAAEIGRRLGGNAQWCGTFSNSAILVNGATDSLQDAIIASPLANRLQMPMLLTRTDSLPQHTIDFIHDRQIKHVAIVGGQEGVDADVVTALRSAGVDTVNRYAGTDAADTSAVVAKLAVSGDCSEYLAPVSANAVALVKRSDNGVADGIAASLVLNGAVPGVDGLVPLLLVGDSLPSPVRAYLAATPEEDASGNKVEFNILAIGGNAAVLPAVMRAALSAAASAPALSVDIVAVDDSNGNGLFDDRVIDGASEFRLNFSDDIDPDVPSLTAKLLDAIRISGSPMVLASSDPVVHGAGGATSAACVPDQVTVKLASPLRGGQTIALANTSLQFGAASDKRPLTGDSVTVVTPSNTVPNVAITALIGQSTVWVDVTDAQGFSDTETLIADELTPTKSSTSGTPDLSVGTPTAETTSESTLTSRRFSVPLLNSRALVSGDSIKVNKDAITDLGGLKNAAKSQSAAAPGRNPSLQSVWLSNEAHTSQASYVVPTSITSGDGRAEGTADVLFTARKGGGAAGANGNGWSFYFRRASTYNADQARGKALSVDVHVNQSAKQAFVTFEDGVGRMADLKKALEADRTFNALWEVSIEPVSQDDTCVLANTALTVPTVTVQSPAAIATGYTMVALRVEFTNGHVEAVYGGPLFDDILQGALGTTRANQADKNAWLSIAGVDIWQDKATFDNTGRASGTYSFGDISGPLRRVRFEIRASETKYLPRSGDRVIVTKGTDTTDSIAEGYDDSEPTSNPNNLVDPYRFNNATSTTGISINRTSSVSSPTG